VAVLLREVFLASNFAEFTALRAELTRRIDKTGLARAIDLNDNEADPQSPLRRSLGRIRSSDLVVLLVGAAYGQDKPDGKRSYTHVEYEEARAEGIPTLPYFLGPGYANKERRPRRGDPQLHPLQRELLGHDGLTISFLDADSDLRELADAILDQVRRALLGSGNTQDQDDDEIALLDEGSLGTDLYTLEKGKRTKTPFNSELDALRRPAEAAAAEQLHEDQRALNALDRGAAIHHFKKALELRPLEAERGSGNVRARPRALAAEPRPGCERHRALAQQALAISGAAPRAGRWHAARWACYFDLSEHSQEREPSSLPASHRSMNAG
jgi:hypothetical protein